MKKQLAVFAFMVLIVFQANAQPEADPIRWTSVSLAHEEFDFDLPIEDFAVGLTSASRIELSYYKASHGKTVFSVATGSKIDSIEVVSILNFASKFDPRCKAVAILDTFEYQCSFEESGFIHSFKLLSTKNRYYRFYAYTDGDADPSVDTFLASVRFVRKIVNTEAIDQGELSKVWARFESTLDVRPNKTEESRAVSPMPEKSQAKQKAVETPRGIGSGAATGSGDGMGGGPGKRAGAVVNRIPRPDDETLQILSRPSPDIPEIAKRFEITGQVKLSVVFYPDGSIGSVEAIERLPFGLTQSAIMAARAITFSAEKRNGIPIGVKKTVIFNFYMLQ